MNTIIWGIKSKTYLFLNYHTKLKCGYNSLANGTF